MSTHCRHWRTSKAHLLLLALALPPAIQASPFAEDQEKLGLPNAPSSEPSTSLAISSSRKIPAASQHHSPLTLNRVSLSILVAGEALDSWTTYKNLSHHKWICGYSPALGNAVTYISDDGKRYDPPTIQHQLCGPSPSGQLANYAYDVTRTGAFTETGWVTSMRLTSNRNIAGVLAWNLADDASQMLIAHYLARRRGLIGRFAPGINLARGLVHIDCGIENLLFARTHNNATTWQFHLPNESTLYPGPRWWGRQ
ncbi:MAG: hypothetical protein JST28_20095 [Acidobacteria bacterium]|nr:hypothetical protein [Acidobacteriota bacterium]